MHSNQSAESAFVFTANQKVVSLLVQEAGFQSAQASALDALADILGLYLERLLAITHSYADLANRSRPNTHDLAHSLADQGVALASLQQYVERFKNTPMAKAASSTTLRTEQSQTSTVEYIPQFLPSEDEDEDEDLEETTELPTYVPPHLPRFPSKHSFRQTPVYIQRPDDPQKVRELNSQQSRTVEENLKRLMSSENQLARRSTEKRSANGYDEEDEDAVAASMMMMPIVNYESAMQRRKRVAKQPEYGNDIRNQEASKRAKSNVGTVQS
ncbi:hypothetical protein EC973_003569 [Apophysomyces ossiformis]|uniref:Transcription initiation factor TFIID subunit 8 n=1 Tax=Apophysomyces ossiformis TaxID=679940 RepID=A0A8H7EQH4_9FUNG|nr:hypothetical protein EC973_003569 [Apophysomyces ossiformis]